MLKQVEEICHTIEADEVRRLIIEDKVRPDGRKINELRPLNSQVDLLPRAHGSAMFTRGETQVLSVTTLGAMNDNQIIDDLTEVESKRFMHHYNFPPYSVGETGRMGSPGTAVRSGMARWASAHCLQVLPPRGGVPIYDPHRGRSARIQRFLLPGFHLCGHDVADGGRCADQGAGGRHRHGPDHG